MLTNEEIFQQLNDRINRTIISDPDFQKAKASGNAERSLLKSANVTITPTLYRKKAVAYLGAIDDGRSPNRSNSGGLFQGLYNWLEYEKYGFKWKPNERKRKALAFALMKSIAKKGSSKYRGKIAKTSIIADALQKEVPLSIKQIITQKTLSYRSEIRKAYGRSTRL